MKCRANPSVQRREFKKQKCKAADEILNFCEAASLVVLAEIFHWSRERLYNVTHARNEQYYQVQSEAVSLGDYRAALKADYGYSADNKLRCGIIKPKTGSGTVQLADERLRQLRQTTYREYNQVTVLILRDKFGWGKSMCDKYLSAMNRKLEDMEAGRESCESLVQRLRERHGIRLNFVSVTDRRLT